MERNLNILFSILPTNQNINIQVSTCISIIEDIYFEGKLIVIKVHAIKRARERDIAFPDQVYNVIQTGKVKRFGKNYLKFTKRGKHGSVICVGEDLGHCIIIKTIERGN